MIYGRDGITVIRGYLELSLLERIETEIEDLFIVQARHLHLPGAGLHEVARALLRADVARYIATARTTQDLPSVHRLLTSDPILRLATVLGISFPLISTKASVHIMADDLAVPGGYHRSPPHQDWRSIQGSLDNLVLWNPTTPVNRNGLEVVPCSHKLGLLETVEHIMTPAVYGFSDEQFVHVDCEPGDVVAFSSFLVHRTAVGPGLRIALSTRFNNGVEPSYVERGYPTPYSYSYRTDLMEPVPRGARIAAPHAG